MHAFLACHNAAQKETTTAAVCVFAFLFSTRVSMCVGQKIKKKQRESTGLARASANICHLLSRPRLVKSDFMNVLLKDDAEGNKLVLLLAFNESV